MLQDRNLTAHTYNEQLAKTIYREIKEKYLDLFLALRDRLKGEID